MSSKLSLMMKSSMVSLLDLAIGSTIAHLMGVFFTVDTKAANHSIPGLLAEIGLQTVLTVLISDELRSLTYPEGFDDPTGGLVFIVSVFRQPTLWEKVDCLWNEINQRLFGVVPTNPSVCTSNPPEKNDNTNPQ